MKQVSHVKFAVLAVALPLAEATEAEKALKSKDEMTSGLASMKLNDIFSKIRELGYIKMEELS